MAKGYWVAHIDVDDIEKYKKYVEANAAPLAKYGAKFLVRGGQKQVPEGEMRERIIVLEFPDYETALACYHSPEYTAARALRVPVSTGSVAIVEGWEN